MTILKKYFLPAIVIIFMILPSTALAGGLKNAFGNGSPLDRVGQGAGVDTDGDLGTVTGRVINAALTLVGIIFLILMVYGGYLWMTARGNEDQVKKAQQVIYGTIIGLVIVMSAYAITKFVTTRLEQGG